MAGRWYRQPQERSAEPELNTSGVPLQKCVEILADKEWEWHADFWPQRRWRIAGTSFSDNLAGWQEVEGGLTGFCLSWKIEREADESIAVLDV